MKSAILNILANFAQTVSTFLLLRLAFHDVGSEYLGVWVLIFTATTIARLPEFGVTTTIVRMVAEFCSKEKRRTPRKLTIVAAAICAVELPILSLSAVIAPISLPIVNRISDGLVTQSALWMITLMATSVCILQGASSALGAILEGNGEIDRKNQAMILAAPSLVGAYTFMPAQDPIARVALAYLFHISLQTAILTVFLATSKSTWDSSRTTEKRTTGGELVVQILRSSAMLTGAGVLRALLEPLTKYSIGWVGSPSDVFIVDIAMKLSTQTRTILQSATQPLYRIFVLEAKENLALLERKNILQLLSSSIFFSAAVILMPLASLFFLSRIDAQLIWVGVALMAASYINSLGQIGYLYIISTKAGSEILTITAAMTAINLAICLVGIAMKNVNVVVLAYALAFMAGGFWGMAQMAKLRSTKKSETKTQLVENALPKLGHICIIASIFVVLGIYQIESENPLGPVIFATGGLVWLILVGSAVRRIIEVRRNK